MPNYYRKEYLTICFIISMELDHNKNFDKNINRFNAFMLACRYSCQLGEPHARDNDRN